MTKNIAYGLGILLLALFLYLSVFSTSETSVAGFSKGSEVPDFTAKTIDGRELTLSKLRGKVVLLNFWATWCPPCRSEMPLFQKVYQKYKDRGFEIIGISTDASQGQVQKFIKEYGLTFPIIMDDQNLTAKFNVSGLPTSFLIDRDGRVIKVRLGEYEEIEKDLKKLFVK
jgi:peroxiredoxin